MLHFRENQRDIIEILITYVAAIMVAEDLVTPRDGSIRVHAGFDFAYKSVREHIYTVHRNRSPVVLARKSKLSFCWSLTWWCACMHASHCSF